MKNLSLLFVFLFSFSTYAKVKVSDVELPYNEINSIIRTDIGDDNTCLDEFIQREQQLRKFLIWAPPATIVAAPVTLVVSAYSAAFISNAVGVTGWAGLGYAIGGAMIGGASVIGSFIGLETAKAIEFSNNRYMIKLIVSIHNREFSKQTSNFIKRYRSKFPNDIQHTDEDILHLIEDLDFNGALCNGVVTGKTNKFKKKLARRRHLLNYIHNL